LPDPARGRILILSCATGSLPDRPPLAPHDGPLHSLFLNR
jgi:hypothetical protein